MDWARLVLIVELALLVGTSQYVVVVGEILLQTTVLQWLPTENVLASSEGP